MFGREPLLPIYLILDNPGSPVRKNHTDSLKQWEKSMSEAYKIAPKNVSSSSLGTSSNVAASSHCLEASSHCLESSSLCLG